MAWQVLVRGWIESFARYPVTFVTLAAGFGLIWYRRRKPSGVLRPSRPSDAMWFTPVYLWGVESICHAHWWAFEAQWGGIAPNMLWIGIYEAFYSAAMLAVVCGGCFVAERQASKVGLRAREPQATLPVSVVASILSVVEAWSLLIWAMSPGFLPYSGR